MKTETILVAAAVGLLLLSARSSASTAKAASATTTSQQLPLWQRIAPGIVTTIAASIGTSRATPAASATYDALAGYRTADGGETVPGESFYNWESNFQAPSGDPDGIGYDYAGTAANSVTNARARH